MLRTWQAKNMTTKTIYNKNSSIPVRFNLERKISVLIHVQKDCICCGSILFLVQILFSSFSKSLSYFTAYPRTTENLKFKLNSRTNLDHNIYGVSQTKIAPNLLFRRALWTSEGMKQASAPSRFQYASLKHFSSCLLVIYSSNMV